MYVSPARLSHMYYEQGMTQQQIADATNLSRIRVSRLLQQARADGIVRISITYSGFYPELERKLGWIYPGRHFIVCDSLDGSDQALKRSLASATADYVSHVLHEGETVALGWGTTLREMADCLQHPLHGVTWVPLIGGQVYAGLDVHANSIAEAAARNTGSRALRMFAPAVAETVAERDLLVASEAVSATLRRAAGASTVLFSLGAPFSESSTIEQVGYYNAADIDLLRESGAACDLISISYFDAEGRECAQSLSERTVSITQEQLRGIERKVCVAGGRDKRDAVRIAMALNLVDVLITDEQTALYLTGDALTHSEVTALG